MTREARHPIDDRRARMELLHDRELSADARAQLRRALERDESLRAELRDIRLTDGLIREALTSPRPAPRRVGWLAKASIGLGGGALAAVLLAFLIGPRGSVPTRPAPPGPTTPGPATTIARENQPSPVATLALQDPPAARIHAARVLFSVTGSKAPEKRRVGPTDAEASQAVAELRSDDPAQREQAALELGHALRSARAAEAALDALSPGEQLGVIRLWSRHPSLRPVAFDRLERLAAESPVSVEALDLARSLAGEPELSPWVHSRRTLRSAIH